MNFLRQALAFFFPPVPPPMRRRSRISPVPCRSKSPYRTPVNLRTPTPANFCPPRPPVVVRRTEPLSSDKKDEILLDCEIRDNSKRSKEYELGNPDAFRQDVQKKIEHILIIRKKRGRPRKIDCDACTCGRPCPRPASGSNNCSTAELERQGVQAKIKRVQASETDMRPSGSFYSLSGTLECDTCTDIFCPPSCSCSLASCSFAPYPSESQLDLSVPVIRSESSTIYLNDSPSRSPVSFGRTRSVSPSLSQPGAGDIFERNFPMAPPKAAKPSRAITSRAPRKRKSRRVRTVRKKRTKC